MPEVLETDQVVATPEKTRLPFEDLDNFTSSSGYSHKVAAKKEKINDALNDFFTSPDATRMSRGDIKNEIVTVVAEALVDSDYLLKLDPEASITIYRDEQEKNAFRYPRTLAQAYTENNGEVRINAKSLEKWSNFLIMASASTQQAVYEEAYDTAAHENGHIYIGRHYPFTDYKSGLANDTSNPDYEINYANDRGEGWVRAFAHRYTTYKIRSKTVIRNAANRSSIEISFK